MSPCPWQFNSVVIDVFNFPSFTFCAPKKVRLQLFRKKIYVSQRLIAEPASYEDFSRNTLKMSIVEAFEICPEGNCVTQFRKFNNWWRVLNHFSIKQSVEAWLQRAHKNELHISCKTWIRFSKRTGSVWKTDPFFDLHKDLACLQATG